MKVFVSLLFCFSVLTGCQSRKYDIVIRNATVYSDGMENGKQYDVAIQADTIAVVLPSGDLKATGTKEIDATNLILAPGFIDTHSHHDRGLSKNPFADAVVSQGITTIIVGQDGGSDLPLRKYFQLLADSPVAVNIGSYSGHNTLRDQVVGKDFKRKSTQAEIDSMIKLLHEDMKAGAFGLSTGLEYDPGIYSSHDEVLQLSKVLPQYNGR